MNRVIDLSGMPVVLRDRLKVKHRRQIEAATHRFLGSGLGQRIAAAGVDIEDMDDTTKQGLLAEHAGDMALQDGISDATILAYVESVNGQEPTADWLSELDEDDYATLDEATTALEKARRARMPDPNPDGADDLQGPTGA